MPTLNLQLCVVSQVPVLDNSVAVLPGPVWPTCIICGESDRRGKIYAECRDGMKGVMHKNCYQERYHVNKVV